MLEVEQLDRARLAECQGRRLAELLQKISGRNQFYTRKFRDAGIDIGASAQPAVEVPTAVQQSGFQGLAGPRGAADDLKKLTGVSGAIEKKLNDLGVFHYWQLAELDHDTAHQIGEEVGLPSRADAWVAQAKTLTAEAE